PDADRLHLITLFEVDNLGRVTKRTDHQGTSDERITFTVYKDATHEVRTYPGWDTVSAGCTANPCTTGPIQVTRDDRAIGYEETFTMAVAPRVVSGKPDGGEDVSNIQSLTRMHRAVSGQVIYADRYIDLNGLTYPALGTANTHFFRTEYQYDN